LQHKYPYGIRRDNYSCNGIRLFNEDSLHDESLLLANIPQLQLTSITGSPSTLNSTSVLSYSSSTALDHNELASTVNYKTTPLACPSLTNLEANIPGFVTIEMASNVCALLVTLACVTMETS
jgi:hypothetical protein